MDKNRWVDFLATNRKSQIALESSQKIHTWGLAILGFISLGIAINVLTQAGGRGFIFSTKVLFLTLYHVVMVLGFYLPNRLQKGESPVAGYLGIRDNTSLVLFSLILAAFSGVLFTVAYSLASGLADLRVSAFFVFMAWTNVVVTGFYLTAAVLYFLGSFFFPNGLTRFFQKVDKATTFLLIVHSACAVAFGFAYNETTVIGSAAFYEQFRVASLFWIFMGTTTLVIGRLSQGSAISALTSLQLDVVSGKLDRGEDILGRFREAFILKRLSFWVNRLSHSAATKSHDIARYTHESMSLINQQKPSESDLRSVEEAYRKADQLWKKLNRQNQKFLLSVSFFSLSEAEREKIEQLRDQFSKELRNAKLELNGVRKTIDEKLVAIKNNEKPSAPSAEDAPVEKVPVSK